LAVVFTCEWCGETVELAASDAGQEIRDVSDFLAQHRSCLKQRTPAPGS
jgi:hypothetical protein